MSHILQGPDGVVGDRGAAGFNGRRVRHVLLSIFPSHKDPLINGGGAKLS